MRSAKMKHFATYFTHGVRRARGLRSDIYHCAGSRLKFWICRRVFQSRSCSSGPSLHPRTNGARGLVNCGAGARTQFQREKNPGSSQTAPAGQPRRAVPARHPALRGHRVELLATALIRQHRMELTRRHRKFARVERALRSRIVTDSEYVKNGITMDPQLEAQRAWGRQLEKNR